MNEVTRSQSPEELLAWYLQAKHHMPVTNGRGAPNRNFPSGDWSPPREIPPSVAELLPGLIPNLDKSVKIMATDKQCIEEIKAMTYVMRRVDALPIEGVVAYAEGLTDLPWAVVHTVCREVRKTEKWMPSLSEIREKCEARLRHISQQRQRVLSMIGLNRFDDEERQHMAEEGWSVKWHNVAMAKARPVYDRICEGNPVGEFL